MATVILNDGSKFLVKENVDEIARDCVGKIYKFLRLEVIDFIDRDTIPTLFPVSQIKYIQE